MSLFARSVMVLALLFGLVFAVGAGVLYYYNFPLVWAVGFAVVMVSLQYAVGSYIIDWIYKIDWRPPESVSPEFAAFLNNLCAKRGIPVPRFGIIEDGNPNAFTYGHVPGNARLVVTRGLLEMLTPEESNAVVAHEVGHIRHYDFIVMTMASLVPVLLYLLYAWTRERRQGSGAAAFAVAVGAYIAYFVSQYIVLFLSRIREYFADEHAAQSVENANAISTALIKIAYGLARIPQKEEKQQVDADGKKTKKKQPAFNKSQLMGSLGICNFSSASSMALYATSTTGQFSTDHMVKAMQWDLWNPWARFFEIQSTHPLIARRVQAASKIVARRNQQPAFPISMPVHIALSSFLLDLSFISLPWLGITIGIIAGSMVHKTQRTDLFSAQGIAAFAGYILLFGGLGWLMRLAYSFGSDFKPAKIVDLVGEVDVSHIRSIPVELTGEIIGRGIPGLFWSKDLVLQDESGFITLIYRQPLGILEFLFGLLKANDMVGRKGIIRGWYRRGPAPYLELLDAHFDTGIKVRCYQKSFLWFAALMCTLIGAALTFV